MLPEVKAGHLIRKRKYAAPPLVDIDPNFVVEYNEDIHGKMLCDELNVSHLPSSQQTTLTALSRDTGVSSAKKVLLYLSRIMNMKLILVMINLLLVKMPPLAYENFPSSKKLSTNFLH